MYQVLSGLLSEVDFHLERLVDDCQTLLLGIVLFLICVIFPIVCMMGLVCSSYFGKSLFVILILVDGC